MSSRAITAIDVKQHIDTPLNRDSNCHAALGRRIHGPILILLILLVVGCATHKDLQEVRTDVGNQLSGMRSDLTQFREGLESMRSDVALLKSLGVAVDTVKGRVDTIQGTVQGLQSEADSHRSAISTLRSDFREVKVAHEGVVRETDRLRVTVGSIEQGMIHQLQVEVNLARERIKQLEQVIESLQKTGPPQKEGGAQPRL
jgi:chromosome segregation ATPase